MFQNPRRLCFYSAQTITSKAVRQLFLVVLLAAFVFTLSSCATTDRAAAAGGISTAGRPNAEYEADKKRAVALWYDEHDSVEVLPILEKLAAENPADLDVVELLSACLFSYTPAIEKGSAEKRKALLRSRELAQKAKKMGSKFLMMDLILEAVSADGSYVETFSRDKAVDEVMKNGEAFFARNDIERALEAYRTAEALDPALYKAPLYIGDCYFILKRPDDAGRAFARAIAIDPNLETAYRWWGDALMKARKMEEARQKFIEAIVAEPYSRLAWNGISQWALLNNKQIGHFQFKIPVSVTLEGDVVVDEKALSAKNGTQNWLLYSATRVYVRKAILSKTDAKEKYRRSLYEEGAPIRAMLSAVTDQVSKGELKPSDLDGPIQFLMKLNSEGLLEAYILLALADKGISQDYQSYRTENREAIRKYLDRYVIHDKQ